MANQTDQKEYEKLIVYLRSFECARKINPALYSSFNQILAFHEAKLWSFEDPGFRAALEDFYKQFQDYLQNLPETIDLDRYAPRETVEKVFAEAEKSLAVHDKNFPQRLVDNYVKRAGAISKETARALAENLAEANSKSKSPEEMVAQTTAAVRGKIELDGVDQRVLAEVIQDHREEIIAFSNREQVVSTIVEDALNAPVERPEIYAKIDAGLIIRGKLEPVARAKEAQGLTRLAEALLTDAHPFGGGLNKILQEASNISGNKAAQVANSVINAALGPEQLATYLEIATGKAFKQAVADPKNLRELSPEFVASPLYRSLVEQGRAVFKEPSKKIGGNFIGRLTSSIVLNQALRGLGGDPKQTIQNVFKLAELGVLDGSFGPKGSPPPEKMTSSSTAHALTGAGWPAGVAVFVWSTRDLFIGTLYARLPTAFHFDFNSLSGWLLNLGAREVGKKAVEGGVRIGAGVAGQKFIGGALGTLLGGPGIGTVVGAAITTFVGDLLGKATNFAKSMIGITKGEPAFLNDLPLAIAVFAVGFIVVAFILPLSFIPLNNVADKVRTVALETSGEKPIGGGATANLAQKSYPNIPLPPASSITRCPVDPQASERITQGPGKGDHTGDHYNAYDIALHNNTPVYPSHNGVVVDFYPYFPQSQHVDKSAGNFVKIEGIDSNGQTYFTIYEHLLGVASGISVGAKVTTNQYVGYSDDTGNSTGPHLHYECQGAVCPIMMPAGCGGS